ncbi:MAG: N-dimethylarginine dimethylaminohydrolase [Cellulomonas sp.]|uniref:Amidinotransferase n=1 Tax=Cellulomonas gelida TaxID=1712 RepID=A0A4Y3KM05_9CELL|nr:MULTISPECIES: dimethylargininase [Cellulomonas]KMM45689.1 N-dimethylarginine dimethylaminohydrolase [Cellulomonas sp. A375-1]MCR6649655.1 N-dimethylarginine dimethylaminohydrolase [Cellulomonas sp.]MCR6705629.1 N-dimethylarginine dimethylaminohydrolase [Cellulomonas sp.]GEA85062.1 amidinotransferase [Cellulomonas gelida]GGL16392.1 amidinotransferase [Cellulomonas gelida]
MTATAPGRTDRHYLMCEPVHYTVSYEINPWMDATRYTDVELALRQWRTLRDTYLELGHRVETIEPIAGLPDMVYAANGATVVDGVVYSAKFRHPERQPEGPAYQKWFADRGYVTHTAAMINEGEGDILVVGDLILAGTGFRTERAAHAEAQELFGRPVVSLELVNPSYYHLDTALAVISSDPASPQIAYYPAAFSAGSRAVLNRLFPDAILATDSDAVALGLNAVSDGENVVVAPGARDLAAALRERGYTPIPVDTSELLKGGGGAKCCTLEIRA